jgi:putative heme-binding domain-containing protein
MAIALQGQRKATPPKGWGAAATVFAVSQDAAVRGAFRTLGAIFADPAALLATQKTVLDPQAGKPARREALRSLIEARADGLRPLCEQLLTEPALLATAAGGLALEADVTLVDLILKHYPSAAPEDRAGLVSTLISRATWAARLLQGVTDGRVPLKDLTAFHARQIRNYQDPALTKMVTGIWGDVRESTAEKIARIAQWKTQLTKPVLDQADRAKGRLLYQSLCATCHVLNGEGGRIGPELTGSNRDNLDYLLQNIGDPGSVVAKDYQLTTLTMNDARVLAGFIRSKNDRTLTLQTLAETITVPLSDIGQTEIAPISLMPEGLLESLNANDLRDLIGYLMAK